MWVKTLQKIIAAKYLCIYPDCSYLLFVQQNDYSFGPLLREHSHIEWYIKDILHRSMIILPQLVFLPKYSTAPLTYPLSNVFCEHSNVFAWQSPMWLCASVILSLYAWDNRCSWNVFILPKYRTHWSLFTASSWMFLVSESTWHLRYSSTGMWFHSILSFTLKISTKYKI